MNAGIVRLVIVALLVSGSDCHAESREQSLEAFAAAIKDSSSAPRYVRIVLTDGNTSIARDLCTLAPFLLGAIHIEYGIAYDVEGIARAREFALSTIDHRFTFYRTDAIHNISSKRTSREIEDAQEEVDKVLASLPDHRLRSVDVPNYWRGEAIACALIDKGYSVGMRDLSGNIYLLP